MSDSEVRPGGDGVEGEKGSAVKQGRRRWILPITLAMLAGAVVTAGIAALLVNIMQRKSEGTTQPYRVVELTEDTDDPAVWGQNFPLQYETYKKTTEMAPQDQVPRQATADDPRTVTAHSKIEADPRLVTIWQGYAFAVDYREPRGHEYMLVDQQLTKRVTQFKQPGACLNCHASTVGVMKKLGNGSTTAGFDAMNKMTYAEASSNASHPVACIDCHDPKTMKLRVTRPALMEGLKAWKNNPGYDVNRDATPQEMRTYVCAQCHIEYYFKGEGKTLTFPWKYGLTALDAVKYYDEEGWTDFEHTLTGAKALKAQHPDFETFSQGVHARAGVTCADCHMSYLRSGATKFTDHQVRSPMATSETINRSCLTCHRSTEAEMKGRVEQIQTRYEGTKNQAFDALDALIQDLKKAQTDGTPADRIAIAQSYQRRAQFQMDYVVSENSRGFHAPQYTMTLLADVTDSARRGQLALRGDPQPMSSQPR